MTFRSADLRRLVAQFGVFGTVGVAGLVVDMAALRLCLALGGLDPYTARILSFLAAATTTWALNRRFTFHAAPKTNPLRQWAAFIAANSVGGAVNYAVYAGLVSYVAVVARVPELGVAAGSVAGMFLNFAASKRLIFRGG